MYYIEKKKMEKHVNLLYVQNDVGHFAWIKNLSRLELTTQ